MLDEFSVAPLVGAWIEISDLRALPSISGVAPLVGAWIEICHGVCAFQRNYLSLPSWERGLKFERKQQRAQAITVAPLVGAWIEILS